MLPPKQTPLLVSPSRSVSSEILIIAVNGLHLAPPSHGAPDPAVRGGLGSVGSPGLHAPAGATVAFLAARIVGRDWTEEKLSGPLKKLKEGVDKGGWEFVAFVRLVP
jgi:hypothetical protein